MPLLHSQKCFVQRNCIQAMPLLRSQSLDRNGMSDDAPRKVLNDLTIAFAFQFMPLLCAQVFTHNCVSCYTDAMF